MDTLAIQTENCDKRIGWIDLAKFWAIIAVLIDHTNGKLYTDQRVAYFSYYSVELFILVMGITTFWSYKKRSECFPRIVSSKCWKIVCPYLMATFLYCIAIYHFFDLQVYIVSAD